MIKTLGAVILAVMFNAIMVDLLIFQFPEIGLLYFALILLSVILITVTLLRHLVACSKYTSDVRKLLNNHYVVKQSQLKDSQELRNLVKHGGTALLTIVPDVTRKDK